MLPQRGGQQMLRYKNIPWKRLIRNCRKKMWMTKMLLKKGGKNGQNLQPVLLGGRGDDKKKRGAEKRKQDSLHCASALQDPCWHFNLISWKKRTSFYKRYTQWCPSCLHNTVLLPSRFPADISIWSERCQISRWRKYRFHFVCISFKFPNILSF